ncbi:MAG: GNAT family N-acetyltransferase [Candidatus Magasanikbacteria bacterium]
MEIKKHEKMDAYAIKFTVEENGKLLGRSYLYIIFNELHHEPYGLLEDVFVEQEARGRGIGTILLDAVIKEAKEKKCYKLIATSRHSREHVHEWYKKTGFKEHGIEFRMDL